MEELSRVYNPHDVEDRIYRKWEEGGYFHASPKSGKTSYSIVIPPPNITGILHMGHALNNTIQDILIRFKRMQGFEAEWMPGTDHAGIATQNVVEKKLLKEGRRRHDLGREGFIEEVWKWREEYGSTIIRQLKKLGCSCDWERTRFTMDEGLSDAVLEAFARLYEKGLIYKGSYIINWCPRCQTALSDEESQHRDVEGTLYYIKYPVKADSGDDHVVVATTRPETMLGDVAVAVNPRDKRYKGLKGKTLILPLLKRELKVVYDTVVEAKFGTGALKVTPAHDPVDFGLGLKHKLEPINVMNDDGTINANGGDYVGMDRFEAREAIIEDLKEMKLFVKSEPHRHAVGHCYRCHTMVEPRLSPQWFVKMKPLARPAIAAVRKGRIKFFPPRWTKVYLGWMENIRDWCISRQIWWGHRIPVYYCKSCSLLVARRSSLVVRRSAEKAENKKRGIIVSKVKPDKCPDCGSGNIEQDPDVLDTWFSSWLWPFSTFGWPAETAELKYFYPTDSLVTAQEIIFFWVARMVMAGLEFAGDIPFRHVYIHGTVRDETGTKMSKSLGNIIDPLEMIRKYGADALRFSVISITAQGQDVFLSESKFERGRNFANKIWNASRFILMNLKTPEETKPDLCAFFKSASLDLEDRWILSRFYTTLAAVGKSLETYRFNDAANAISEFFWHEFCDWYIELSKPKIETKEKQIILYKVLEKSLRMLHPFMPFITEEIWQHLPHEGKTIMLESWPHIRKDMISKEAERGMALIIEVVTSIRNLRASWGIPPAKEVKVLIRTKAKEVEGILNGNQDRVKGLAKVEGMAIGALDRPRGAATSVLKDVEIFVPLAGLIDVQKEKDKIKAQMAGVEKEIAAAKGRLRDKRFLSKAPKDVVDIQRTRLGELKEKLGVLKANLQGLD